MARIPIATDEFTSSISASWDNGPGIFDTATVASDTMRASATVTDAVIVRNTGAYSNDQYSTVVVGALPSGTNFIGALVRCAGGASEVGYAGYCASSGVDPKYQILRVAAGGGITTLATDGTGAAFAAGDTITLEVIGTTLNLYTREGGGAETLRLTITDATIASGRPGAAVYANTAVADATIQAWEGGDVPVNVPATPSPFRNSFGRRRTRYAA